MTNHGARLAVLVVAIVLAGCGEDSIVGDVAIRVEVTPERDTVVVGEISNRLSAAAFNVRNQQLANPLLTWRSDQPFIASVDSLTGTVTGVSAGVAAITAAAGAISDTAEVFVVSTLALTLPLDTILLAAGDTFTIAVNLIARGQMAPPPITFSGGAGAVAMIDAATGLVTAIGTGTVGFTVRADSLTASGAIEVRSLPDTVFGLAYMRISGGGIAARGRFVSRAFNHPTDDGRSVFQLPIEISSVEQLAFVSIDSLTGPSTRAITLLPESARQPGADVVCLPVSSFARWALFADATRERTVASAFSVVAGGSLAITSVQPITGGRMLSGRFDVRLQQSAVSGLSGEVSAIGTFVVPLLDLSTCPK